MRIAVLASFLVLCGSLPRVSPGAALETPRASITRGDDGRIGVRLERGGGGAVGYDVYRDGRYFTSVVPDAGATGFAFDGAAGRYCLVAFGPHANGRRPYSACGAATAIPPGPPAPPSRVRAAVYSPGTAEVFWKRSPDHLSLAGYEVRRDGVRVDFHKRLNRFEPSIPTSRAHAYEIVAVDRGGRRSRPARYRLPPTAATARRPSVAAAGTGLSVALAPVRPKLREGDPGGVRVAVRIDRRGTDRPVTLSLAGTTPGDERDLAHRFEPATLGAGQTRATLHLTLPVGIAPLLPHARQLRLRASDGRTSAEARLVVDVEPTRAHDVYLLIGQSNMVGYSQRGAKRAGPGEPDEPHPRIRQLNVRPNSRDLFRVPADFTDTTKNVASLAYTRAEDPLHDPRRIDSVPKYGTFVGPGLAFAKAALARTTRTVYLVPAAWGASGFCANGMGDLAWNATPYAAPGLGGSLLLERALGRLNKTLKETGGVLRGILWHQGGADSHDRRCAERYADNLVKMVARLRREARPDIRGRGARGERAPVPFVVATMSKGADERGAYGYFSPIKHLVDAAHRNVASLIPYADFVDNDDLIPPAYPCGLNSCVHFGAAAAREQGRRFDAALRRIVRRR